MLAALLLGACDAASPGDSGAFVTPSSGTLSILALGDSYTIGEGVDAAQPWPVQLAQRLRDNGLSVSDPQIIARTGWTTDELSAAMDRAVLQPPYDLVTLLIGVNNQYRGRNAEEYQVEFVALLQRALALVGGDSDRVLVLSIPDYSVTPFGAIRDAARIAREIDQFNAINREETLRAGARYIDITPTSRASAREKGLVAGDGLHPSGRQYSLWADLALPEALTAMKAD